MSKFDGLEPIDYLRGIRDGNIIPTLENLQECLRIVLEPCNVEHLKFEEWAAAEKYDMHEHPLHYLFLDAKTYAARQGWKAALRYIASALPSQEQKT